MMQCHVLPYGIITQALGHDLYVVSCSKFLRSIWGNGSVLLITSDIYNVV